jgi:AraC-like DNA-binding protein
MAFLVEQRSSDIPIVSSIWRTESGDVAKFMSVASTKFSLVVMKQYGRQTLTVRGPETRPTLTDCPENAEFFGMEFELGTFTPAVPSQLLVDGSFDMPDSGRQSFWLAGRYWQFPTFENADTFLARLIHEELLQRDNVVEAVLRDETVALSSRTVQRRFQHATGISHRTAHQIERARNAISLLKGGTSILDAVEQAGYADQPHMTRALKRFAGLTPTELARRDLPLSMI